MVFLQGVDLVQISRINKIYRKYGKVFLNKVLSQKEIELLSEFRNDKVISVKIANRFAAKEALVKAIGAGFTNGLSFNQIEIYHNKYGKPFIRVSKKLLDIVKKFLPDFEKFNINLTISDEKRYSIAVVTLTK